MINTANAAHKELSDAALKFFIQILHYSSQAPQLAGRCTKCRRFSAAENYTFIPGLFLGTACVPFVSTSR